MRISFILSSLWLSGGVQVVVEYANRLSVRGHQISLVAPAGTVDADIRAEIDPAVTVRESRVGRTEPMTPWRMARLSWSLAHAVPPSDVVISTHTPTTVAGLLATWLLGRGRPVWLCQDYAEMFCGRRLEAWLFRHACRWHNGMLVVSGYSRNELRTYAPGAHIVAVGEGLSHPELFRQTSGIRTPVGPRTVLFLGDERPRKGMADFLRAAELVYRELADFQLLIVSKADCDIRTEVPHHFVFRPNRHALMQLYADCDLFVSASWREGFGLPPLEAMACGAPVVLTDSGGVRDYARHEENCLLVPPRDPPALADAMLRVLTDPALADRLRRAGPPSAAGYTWEAAVDRFEAALRDVTGETYG